MAASRWASVVCRIGSTVLMRNGSMMVENFMLEKVRRVALQRVRETPRPRALPFLRVASLTSIGSTTLVPLPPLRGMTLTMPEMPRMGIRRLFHLGIAAGLCGLAACGETTVNEALGAGSITPVTASGLTAVVGTSIAQPIEVRVLGTDQQPLAGASVTFTVTAGGGSVSDASATTNADGIASTKWTLGPLVGVNTLAAAASGITTTINAVSTAGRAAAVVVSAGDGQTATAGTAVAVAPAVRVNDANGNAVAGAGVVFSVLTGGGRVTNGVRFTNASGVATVGGWTLGSTAGAQTLSATVSEGAVTNNPVVFTATAVAGTAAQLTSVSATTQTATVATAVSAAPSVRVADANGNPVAGVSVTFAVTSGGGQITGATQQSNAQGIATLGSWVLGNTAGSNQVAAVLAGQPAVVFTAIGTPGAATQMTIRAGNNQTAQAGRLLPVAPSVTVRDAQGNAVAGAVVTFAVATGGGSVVSGRQTSDASGVAEAGGWFLGLTPGVNTLTASVTGLSAVTFTATGTAGSPVSMVANSAVAQTGEAGTAVAARPSVIVRDLVGNAVPGVVVTFTVTAGGGTVTGSPVATDAAGIATLTSWTLGAAAGPNTVVASAAGLPSVTFIATGGAGAAANVVPLSALSQVAVQGTNVTTRPSVRVTDVNGNPVTGATVVFAVTSGGGSVSGATQLTDAAGQASVAAWTLGNQSPNTLTATVGGTGITGNPVTFTAQAATNIAITQQPPATSTLGTNFTVTVQLQDAAAAAVPLAGVPLTIAIASGGGTLNGTATIATSATGAVSFTINVTGTAGARTFSITGAGLTGATTTTITIN